MSNDTTSPPASSIRTLARALQGCLAEGVLPKHLDAQARKLEKAIQDHYPDLDAETGAVKTLVPEARSESFSREARDRYARHIEESLDRIRHAAGEGRDTAELEEALRLATAGDKSVRRRISQARKDGKKVFAKRQELAKLLRKGVLSPDVGSRWQEICRSDREFMGTAGRQILHQARQELKNRYLGKNREEAEKWLAKARQVLGDLASGLALPEEEKGSFVRIPEHTDHSLINMAPSPCWHVYIDETGQSFSETERGREGRIVAVCTREGEELPPMTIHCTEESTERVLSAFAELLLQPCGILGLSRKSLDIRSANGWLQCVRELVKWVWRLVPLLPNGQKSVLQVRVEQRGSMSADTPTKFGEDMLNAELARENPERAQQLVIGHFAFITKTDLHSSWADVASYCWGTTNETIQKALRTSGLFDNALIRHPSHVVDVCEEIMEESPPMGDDWVELVKAHVQRTTPLTITALKTLQNLCSKDEGLWQEYAQAMYRCLMQKEYDPAAMEYMGSWLEPLRDRDTTANYFWLVGRLTHLNNMGDGTSTTLVETRKELEQLAPRMGTLSPLVPLHMALGLARSDANALNFARAEERLAPWNTAAGGTAMGTALWDGLVNLNLAFLRACRNDFAGACHLAGQACRLLEQLPKKEARRHCPEARILRARVALARENFEATSARELVEQALGEDIASFAAAMNGARALDDRQRHALLLHWLVRAGSEEERQTYLAGMDNWCRKGLGLGQGHPWAVIQYLRWLVADSEEYELRRDIARSLPHAMGKHPQPQHLLAAWAVVLSMDLASPKDARVRNELFKIDSLLPWARGITSSLRSARTGDETLALDVLPFSLL